MKNRAKLEALVFYGAALFAEWLTERAEASAIARGARFIGGRP